MQVEQEKVSIATFQTQKAIGAITARFTALLQRDH